MRLNEITNNTTPAGQLDEIFNPTGAWATFMRVASQVASDFIPIGLGAAGAYVAATAVLGPVAGMLAGSQIGNQIFQTLQNQQNKVPGVVQQLIEKYFGSDAEAKEFAILHAKEAFLGKEKFKWRAQEWNVTLTPQQAEAIIEKNDKYWLDQELARRAEQQASQNAEPVKGESALKQAIRAVESIDDGRAYIKRFTRKRIDGSTEVRYNVIDGNGVTKKAFDDLEYAKGYLRANRDLLDKI
jgi:hypothetical protein